MPQPAKNSSMTNLSGESDSLPVHVTPREIEGAYAALLPELEAIPEDALIPVTLDVVSVITTGLGVAPKFDALLPDLATMFPDCLLERPRRLRLYALALMGAHVAYQTARQPPEPVQEYMERVRRMRVRFTQDARPLLNRGLIQAEELAGIRGTAGYKTALNDVAIYCRVFRRHWPVIRSRSCLSETELTEAAELVAQALAVLGEREQAPARASHAALMRQRAFTLFVEVYTEARRSVQFLRFRDKEAEALVPSLYAGRGNTNHRPAKVKRGITADPVEATDDAPPPLDGSVGRQSAPSLTAHGDVETSPTAVAPSTRDAASPAVSTGTELATGLDSAGASTVGPATGSPPVAAAS